MSQNLGSLSFLSRFDPSEFYEIARDLPSSIELNNIDLTNSGTNSSATSYDANFIVNNIDRNSSYEDTASAEMVGAAAALDTNIEIIGTHLLVPQNSIAQMLEANKGILDSTIIDFDSFANILPQPAQNNDTNIIPAASNLPSYETFFGSYNFRINIASSDIPVKKSASWTYSSKLNKLYSIPGVACPVEMSVSSMPPYGTQVRVMAVFAKFEHIQDLITRCENHKKSKEFSSDDFPDQALSHFVRCRHPMANYVQDMSNLRESVQIPFERPTTGSNSTTVLLQFMCYSSCIGGSQKPVRIVLTLEHNGEILGRNSFEVKICACPGRDRTTDEKKSSKDKNEEKPAEKNPQNQKAANDSKNTNKNKLADNKSTTTSQVATNNTNKKIDQINIKSVCLPNEDQDEEIFTIKVRGRKNYDILKNLNEALEIQNKLYSKLRKTGDGKIGEIVTAENLSRVISRGSSFIFNNKTPANNNSSTNKTSSSTQKLLKNIPNNLEEFLSQIDLIAYYNLIVSKGIKTIDDLVNASKKKINSLKISERDTTLICNAIEELKARREGKEAVENENEKGSGAKKPKLVDSSEATNQLFTDQPKTSKDAEESFVKLSKYQIRYSSFKKNDN